MTRLRHDEERTPATLASVKLLGIVLAVQVALGITLVALVATDNLPFTGDHEADGQTPRAATVSVDRFDGAAAFRLLRRQVELGPRPAGSPESRRLARLLKRIVPRGRLPGGAGRAPQRGRHRARPRAGLRGRGCPLRHQGHPRASWARTTAPPARRSRPSSPAASGAPATRSSSSSSTARSRRAARPTATSRRRGCAAARSPRRPSRTPARWCCSTSSGDRRLAIRYEDNSSPGLWRKLRGGGRSRGRARGVPARRPGPGVRRPPSVPRGRACPRST